MQFHELLCSQNTANAVCLGKVFIALLDLNWAQTKPTWVAQGSPSKGCFALHLRVDHVGPTALNVQGGLHDQPACSFDLFSYIFLFWYIVS